MTGCHRIASAVMMAYSVQLSEDLTGSEESIDQRSLALIDGSGILVDNIGESLEVIQTDLELFREPLLLTFDSASDTIALSRVEVDQTFADIIAVATSPTCINCEEFERQATSSRSDLDSSVCYLFSIWWSVNESNRNPSLKQCLLKSQLGETMPISLLVIRVFLQSLTMCGSL